MGVRFSTAFFHPPGGQQEEEEPHAPGGDGGDGQGLVEVQGGQGLGLLGQIGGHRGVQGEQPGQQAQQAGGDQAVEQLAPQIGPHGQAGVPQEGQHLAVDGQAGPAQHEGGHGQPTG